jgi:CSLREA domain-containing protein
MKAHLSREVIVKGRDEPRGGSRLLTMRRRVAQRDEQGHARPLVLVVLAVLVGALLAVVPGASSPSTTYAATFTVNSTADTGDDTPDGTCDDGGGNCTLREAIQEGNYVAGADTINFSIGTGLPTITPASALPTITEAVTIDGKTQPGAGYVELNGNDLDARGLYITAGDSTVQRLIIHGFIGSGILLETGGGNVIRDDVIGKGAGNFPDQGNGGHGVRIIGSSNNTVGQPGFGNTLSGNGGDGVLVEGATSVGNVVQASDIGLDPFDLTSPLGNGGNGVTVSGAKNTTILGNIISGNGGSGVYISGAEATGNLVIGNNIGADITGTLDRGNSGDGVYIDGASDNVVGQPRTPELETGNLISGNDGVGVHISGAGAEGNKVQHNSIGVQLVDLASPLGNGSHGVWIQANNNLVGGTASLPPATIPPSAWVVPDTLNIIAHNGDAGVFVDGTGNSIRANNIYHNSSLGIDVSPPGHSWPFSDAKVTSALWTPTPYWVEDKNGNTLIDPDELQWVPEVIATGYIHGGWADTGVVVDAFISSERDPSGFGEGEEWEAGGDTVPPDPPPFYIGADGTMSVAGSFLSDDPVFVPGQYFTDTVTKCEEGHPEGGCIGNGTTNEFSNSVEIVADGDGDGIADQVDTLPSGPYSDLFSDGTTTGTLNPVGTSGRNGCKVSVVDLAPPEGVVLGTLCLPNPAKPDGFEGPAHLEVCEGAKKHSVDLKNATLTFAKCGSAEFSVGYGPVFVGVGTMTARLPTVAEVRFNDPVDGNHEIVNGGTSPTIWVGGLLIDPGATVTVHDTDTDAMADAYETAHDCLDPNVNDAEEDPDYDGVNNLDEAKAGTDPCVANAAVGGIAELPDIGGTSADDAGAPGDGSGWSAGAYEALAGGLAAVAFAIAVGGWYARRRWHKA